MSALEDAHRSLEILIRILDSQTTEAMRNADFGRRLGLAEFGISGTREGAAALVGQLKEEVSEWGILRYVAAFEARAWHLLDNALGEAKKQVKEHYSLPSYQCVSGGLVRSPKDVDSLKDLENLLKGQLTKTEGVQGNLLEDFKKVREHRNWLAHGKRDGDGLTDYKLDPPQVREILERVLTVIEGK